MVFPMAYACHMSSNMTAKKAIKLRKIELPQGRPPLPAGTAHTKNTTVTTTQPQRDAIVAVATREKRPIAHVVMDALRAKYPSDFNGL